MTWSYFQTRKRLAESHPNTNVQKKYSTDSFNKSLDSKDYNA